MHPILQTTYPPFEPPNYLGVRPPPPPPLGEDT